MSEAILQILLLLAYLSIGLISIIFPIFAICVTYLRQEKSETEKELAKRQDILKQKILDLTKETNEAGNSEYFTISIEKQLQNTKTELENIKFRLSYLTAKGVVLIPSIALGIALISASLGINFYYEGTLETQVIIFMFISIIFIIVTVYRLFKTIQAVEYASLRSARNVDFDVVYESREKVQEIKHREETQISIGFGTEEDNLENVCPRIFIPTDIKITSTYGPTHVALQPPKYGYANHNMIAPDTPIVFLPKYEYSAIIFKVTADKIGTYKIPVSIDAKGIYKFLEILTLKVI